MTIRELVKKQVPSDAQKAYGNYRKLHLFCHGLRISIENPRGSTRSGVDKTGRPWESTMHCDYGYARQTVGRDGDQLDVCLGPKYRTAKCVHVIDQVDPPTRKFDEHKVLIGWDTQEEARRAYLKNYERGWRGLGDITTLSMPAFKVWIHDANRTTKPVSAVVKSAAFQSLCQRLTSAPLEKHALLDNPMFRMPAYFVPGAGGLLSAQDALRSGGAAVGHAMGGRWGQAALSGAATAGNTLMALADFIPVLGPAARGKLKALQAGSKAMKGTKVGRKLAEAARLRHTGLQAAKLGQGGINAGRVSRLIGRVADPRIRQSMEGLQKSLAAARSPAEAQRVFQRAAALRDQVTRSRNPFSEASRVRRAYGSLRGNAQGLQNFQRGYANPGKAFGKGFTPSGFHGATTRFLGDRMSPGAAQWIDRLSSRGPLQSYRGAQRAGLSLSTGAGLANVPLENRYGAQQMEAARHWLGM